MYRHRFTVEVKYGHFRDYLKILDDMNEVARARGWKEASIWVPTVGRTNELIVETEYADLAVFQAEQAAFGSDHEAMTLLRKLADHAVQGTARDELLEPAPHPA